MKLFDFECESCGFVFEELVHEGEIPPCGSCGFLNCTRLLSTPAIATMNLLSPAEYKAKMMKRSADHTKKLVAKEGVGGRAAINLTRKGGH
jgi:hypothetical protein